MKGKTGLLLIVSTLALAAAACGKKQEGAKEKAAATAPIGACHYVKDKYCTEYYGNLVTKQWIDENNCKPLKVNVIDKCPTEGAVARCIFDEGTSQMRQIVVYDAKLIKPYCEMAGGKQIPL
ncbi:MAG: hypothetical protein RML34_10680 [Leptospiraceae bacterium]|nr:hypothetical protein [Leptospiraceae bacterium]